MAAVFLNRRGRLPGETGRQRNRGAVYRHELERVAATRRADEHARAHGAHRSQYRLRPWHFVAAHFYDAGHHGARDHHADRTVADTLWRTTGLSELSSRSVSCLSANLNQIGRRRPE